jgi:hypothetical protein
MPSWKEVSDRRGKNMTFFLPARGPIVVPMRVVCYSGWTVGHHIIRILLMFNFMPDFSTTAPFSHNQSSLQA